MKILLLGGTGAMGSALVKLLENTENEVVVTSRSERESFNNIEYIKGNAKDIVFLKSVINNEFDVVVDFMVYTTSEFKERMHFILDNTKQYIFLSSSRVFAESSQPITEKANRLIDVCEDEEYLKTDEYALTKGRQENLLFESSKKNWTVIRPYITYNTNRLQLGVYEKENWLWRCLNGKPIVIPKDILDKKTCITYGEDVSLALMKLIGKEEALGETYNITSSNSVKWSEILDLYKRVIEKETDIKVKVIETNDSTSLLKVWNNAQIKYDRLYDREFDNSKIMTTCDSLSFCGLEKLEECIRDFLKNPQWRFIRWNFEAWADRQSKTMKGFLKIPGFKTKLKYLKWRFLVK
ncbi:MAG: NAD-dependent epimerase/dehydratase family protein [Eubacterium sp.]|nr:NAD-dependent epimerase/dehydratase family protein [Eubacterium sp.]